MRHSNRRSKGRNNNGRGKSNRMQVFDSNGPEVKIRGTANQVADKYMALAKDARSSDDYILEQNYLQHAEHYARIYNEYTEAQEKAREEAEAEKQQKEDDLSLPDTMVRPASNDKDTQEKQLETA